VVVDSQLIELLGRVQRDLQHEEGAA